MLHKKTQTIFSNYYKQTFRPKLELHFPTMTSTNIRTQQTIRNKTHLEKTYAFAIKKNPP